MTNHTNERNPEWTLGDRLRKARSLTGLDVRAFADLIGVSHGTITNAELDRHTVRQITINAWAMATGVSVKWLETGQPTHAGPDDAGACQPPRPYADVFFAVA